MVHHSDRGLQYASAEYVEVLHQHGMLLSMSRAGNPYDNATCESWIKTLKVQEIYGNQYQDLEDLRSHLREFIDQYYNRDRLHSALGPIRVALIMAILETPHRFRNKRVLWKYSGFAVVTQTSADHRYVQGRLERSKKPVSVRGLDPDHNHQLKELFKSAAIQASTREGPFREFYQARVAKGMRAEMAHLTLARKIAVITLTVWKKGVAFDANYLKSQTV
jgi:hypothetical protein